MLRITGANSGYATFNRLDINWTAYYNSSYNSSYNNQSLTNLPRDLYYISTSFQLPYNSTADQLKSMLGWVGTFREPEVTLEEYDALGNVASGVAVYERVYTISIISYVWPTNSTYEIDATNLTNTEDPTVMPTAQFQKTQPHSPPLSGHYYLTLAGVYAGWGYTKGLFNDRTSS